jgi:hypothetical protein
MGCVMVFNAAFNNISAISRRSVCIGGGNRSTRRKPPTLERQLRVQNLKHHKYWNVANFLNSCRDRRGSGRVVVGFITTYVISS